MRGGCSESVVASLFRPNFDWNIAALADIGRDYLIRIPMLNVFSDFANIISLTGIMKRFFGLTTSPNANRSRDPGDLHTLTGKWDTIGPVYRGGLF